MGSRPNKNTRFLMGFGVVSLADRFWYLVGERSAGTPRPRSALAGGCDEIDEVGDGRGGDFFSPNRSEGEFHGGLLKRMKLTPG